jgi:hypothetical protein
MPVQKSKKSAKPTAKPKAKPAAKSPVKKANVKVAAKSSGHRLLASLKSLKRWSSL